MLLKQRSYVQDKWCEALEGIVCGGTVFHGINGETYTQDEWDDILKGWKAEEDRLDKLQTEIEKAKNTKTWEVCTNIDCGCHYCSMFYQQYVNYTSQIIYIKDAVKCTKNLPRLTPHYAHLLEFHCPNIGLEQIPDFSHAISLILLKCDNNRLTHIKIPPTLQTLICSKNRIESLSDFPQCIIKVECNQNSLLKLPELKHTNMQYLDCVGNKLTYLPELSPHMKTLLCAFNQLKELPLFPLGLVSVECEYNKLCGLPPLNMNLTKLNCSYNRISFLPVLNNALSDLNCIKNRLHPIQSFDENRNSTHRLTPETKRFANRWIFCRHRIMCFKYKKHFLRWYKRVQHNPTGDLQ